jgi:hypothetical protein
MTGKHGDLFSEGDLFGRQEPFYKNTDDLLDWIADEEVPVAQVAKWVVTPPSETRGSDYNSLAPEFIVRVNDLPHLFEAFMKLNVEAARQVMEESRVVTLDYAGGVKLRMSKEQIKAALDYACGKAGKDIVQLLRDLGKSES